MPTTSTPDSPNRNTEETAAQAVDEAGDKAAGYEAAALGFDLLQLPAGFCDDPYPLYRALRRYDPVHHCPDGSYFLTRYRDLMQVYRDANRFSSDKKREFKPKFGDSPLYTHHTTSLVFNDPPLHTGVRKLIVSALTPRAISHMQASIITLVDRLLDHAADSDGKVDLITDFAAAIPIEVIGNLLAIPRAERAPLRDWSLAILGALEPTLSAAQLERGNCAVRDFSRYLQDLITARRKTPGNRDTDVLTRLIEGDVEGQRLSEMQLVHNCIFILNAGHETTTNLIGNGLHLLHKWPNQRQRLLGDPALIDPMIEETLRFESSNQLGNRMSREACTISGSALPAGTRLTLCIAAANRDPDIFHAPDQFDIARRPNKHLAFGNGAHTCAGTALARMEGAIAIGRLVARFPRFDLTAPPQRSQRVRFRGLVSLPAHLH